jgi:hypothetical protein
VKALGRFDDPTTAGALDERTEDEDREVAIRAVEALLSLAGRPRSDGGARAARGPVGVGGRVCADGGGGERVIAEPLDEAFDLVSLPLRGRTALATEPIRAVYISRVDPRLRVVDKANGGRSDAINAASRSRAASWS